ncbi:polyphenol oxidase family protein [Psychrobacter sp. 72-O-c]|uniref:polyphenol oxidase family protein n=1 Tax=Psychrobacter sp. 72-O-c TaxID=2774125 RepID=UPI0019187685|nr:polyphenol oxidase family protein [Psychrobacter sp. 72-O-c]
MTNKLPMTLLAQLDDVAVFQTAAFASADVESLDVEGIGFESISFNKADQKMRQSEQASYGELNLGLHVSDDTVQVLTNRMRLLAAINEQLSAQPLTPQRAPTTSLHWMNQVHSKQIYDVDSTPFSMQPVDADAMISQQGNLGLAVMTADCVPIVLYQPASGQIAAIHAGWQGLACGVIKATAERFSATGQIMAWIGVCVSQANYEVGTHVRDQLLAGCQENKSLAQSNIDNFEQLYAVDSQSDVEPNVQPDDCIELGHLHKTVDKLSNIAKVSTSKVKLNLPKLAVDQLKNAGITVNTAMPIECSYADTRYYSYRRQTHWQQLATGRMALIIVRRPSIAAI